MHKQNIFKIHCNSFPITGVNFYWNLWKNWHLWESDFHLRVWDSNNFHLRKRLSAIPNCSSERFVQIEEGPFAFPEFNLLKNALLRPRPRPTASTLADRIRTEIISSLNKYFLKVQWYFSFLISSFQQWVPIIARKFIFWSQGQTQEVVYGRQRDALFYRFRLINNWSVLNMSFWTYG